MFHAEFGLAGRPWLKSVLQFTALYDQHSFQVTSYEWFHVLHDIVEAQANSMLLGKITFETTLQKLTKKPGWPPDQRSIVL